LYEGIIEIYFDDLKIIEKILKNRRLGAIAFRARVGLMGVYNQRASDKLIRMIVYLFPISTHRYSCGTVIATIFTANSSADISD
jgi:hypothetical protein